ncbi:MAG: hypothetical protein ACYSVY_00305 [Planctomycetota bacterium]
MVALLQEVGRDPGLALAQAIRGFMRREEGRRPEWVAVGPGVELPAGSARMHGLRRAGECERPGCIRVGCGEDDGAVAAQPCHKCGEGLRLPGSIHCYACTQRERLKVDMFKANGRTR